MNIKLALFGDRFGPDIVLTHWMLHFKTLNRFLVKRKIGRIGKNSEVTYEYKGKVYSFCCQGCIIEFSKDPEKYIEKMIKYQ